MCKYLLVSRSSYYAWCNALPSARAKENQALTEKIDPIFNQGRKNYGTRRIKSALTKEGFTVSRRRIGQLMSAKGLLCKTKRKYKVTTNSNHKLPVADNLLSINQTVIMWGILPIFTRRKAGFT